VVAADPCGDARGKEGHECGGRQRSNIDGSHEDNRGGAQADTV